MSKLNEGNYTNTGLGDVYDQIDQDYEDDLTEFQKSKDIAESNKLFTQCCIWPLAAGSVISLTCYGLWWLSQQ